MTAALVPELTVSDLRVSLGFYERLGFAVRYARANEGFAYLEHPDGAELMLEEPRGRQWLAGPLEHPFGRGMNLQVTVADVQMVEDAAVAAGLPLFMPAEQRDYARADDVITVRQFIVADPDGYLIRFSQVTGSSPRQGAA